MRFGCLPLKAVAIDEPLWGNDCDRPVLIPFLRQRRIVLLGDAVSSDRVNVVDTNTATNIYELLECSPFLVGVAGKSDVNETVLKIHHVILRRRRHTHPAPQTQRHLCYLLWIRYPLHDLPWHCPQPVLGLRRDEHLVIRAIGKPFRGDDVEEFLLLEEFLMDCEMALPDDDKCDKLLVFFKLFIRAIIIPAFSIDNNLDFL